MASQDFILKNKRFPADQDYERLRREGLAHIEKLGHCLWTDYNIHDPGITMLELLCYAITDLGYRTGQEIRDILTRERRGIPANVGEFHTARNIFTSAPVTFADLQKVLIDIPGVKHAWVEPHTSIQFDLDRTNGRLTAKGAVPDKKSEDARVMNGLYDVFIDYQDDVDKEEKPDILATAKSRIMENRNLCEDIIKICGLEKEHIGLCADIEVRPGADLERISAEIFFELDRFISPDIRFYSIEELLEKGRSMDEIFQGPALDHGFIDDEEFRKLRRRCTLQVSDIVRIIMGIPGVVSVKEISLLSFIDNIKRDQQPWTLTLSTDRSRSPYFNPDLSRITYYKNGLPFFPNTAAVQSRLKDLKPDGRHSRLKGHKTDLDIPAGKDLFLETYTPVQNEMPDTYRVGRIRVPESASDLRKAQSRQLKAWIMFFEQILANYLSQLANIHRLFSWEPGAGKTYFSQVVKGIPDIKDLFADYDNLGTDLENIVESEEGAVKRKNRFLDHLLARFCESLTDYALIMYNMDTAFTPEKLIADKSAFLKAYPVLSSQRGQGFDYCRPEDDCRISGYQQRVYRLLGIDRVCRRDLSWSGFSVEEIVIDGDKKWQFLLKNGEDQVLFRSIPCDSEAGAEALVDLSLNMGCCRENFRKNHDKTCYDLLAHYGDGKQGRVIGSTVSLETLDEAWLYFQDYANREGFHLIEHVLLRQRGENDPWLPVQLNQEGACHCIEVTDPYSFRFSIILPAWPRRFQDMRFRRFVEETLRMEAPAHTQPRICWISHTQMNDLEIAYMDWAKLLAKQAGNLGGNLGGCPGEGKADFSGQMPLPASSPKAYKDALAKLINTLNTLTTVYPLARLHDCEHMDTETQPVILNSTILGTF